MSRNATLLQGAAYILSDWRLEKNCALPRADVFSFAIVNRRASRATREAKFYTLQRGQEERGARGKTDRRTDGGVGLLARDNASSVCPATKGSSPSANARVVGGE